MSKDDTYVDDEYDYGEGMEDEYDDYDDVEGDHADSFFPTSTAPFGWRPGLWPRGAGEEYGDRPPEGVATEEDEDGGWWDEGLVALLFVAGVVLLLLPEPATSTLGILLVAVAAMAWLADALTG